MGQRSDLGGLWRRFRGLAGWAQLVIAVVVGLVLVSPFTEEEPQTVAATAPASATTVAPTTTMLAATTTAPPVTTTTTRPATTTTTGVPVTSAPTTRVTVARPVPTTAAAVAGGCHPSYSGACVPTGFSDVDCAGGSGNGPGYVSGKRFQVVGPDVYDLDGNDNDGIACES